MEEWCLLTCGLLSLLYGTQDLHLRCGTIHSYMGSPKLTARKKMYTDLPTKQFWGGISLVDVPSSQMTLACSPLTASQHTSSRSSSHRNHPKLRLGPCLLIFPFYHFMRVEGPRSSSWKLKFPLWTILISINSWWSLFNKVGHSI